MIFVYIAEGFEEIEALTTVDVLRRAGLRTDTVALGSGLQVTGAHGITIVCDRIMEESLETGIDAMILPGGMPGAANLAGSQILLERIRRESDGGTLICAICAAPMVLAKAGILHGRKATIYPGMEAEIPDAVLCGDLVCTDGNLITSRGPATAMAFALEIVKKLAGAPIRDKVKEGMLFHD